MRFCLETTRLTELSCTYEALSYVWGPDAELVEIFSAEGLIKVGKNLSDALRRLCLSDKQRYIWADAVRINQPDDQERGRQARLM